MIMRAVLNATGAALVLLFFSTCYAGGENWTFTVTAFSSDHSDKYVVELSPVDKVSSFPNLCTALTVSGEYASLFWFFKFGEAARVGKGGQAWLHESSGTTIA